MKFKFNRRKLTFRRFSYYLLSGTIVISCITNGIFAKFTTESDGGDGARVADFGVVVNISGDLFSTTYSVKTENAIKEGETVLLSPEGSNNPTTYTAKDNTVSVKASSEYVKDEHGKDILNNVVAPGTKNDVGINVSVTGTPETDCQLNYFLSEFQTVALYGGTNGRFYGLMVPFAEGIVNESNFKELVEDGIFYISSSVTENEKTYHNYTKVENTDTYSSSNNYFKLKDTVKFDNGQVYMPVRYYLKNTVTNDEILLNPEYEIFDAIGYGMNGLFSSFANNNPLKGLGLGVGHTGTALGTTTYNTGKTINENFSITWNWPYHQDATGEKLAWCNACDTILGYIAAGKNVVVSEKIGGPYNNNLLTSDVQNTIASDGCYYNLDIIFDYSITIDQVD